MPNTLKQRFSTVLAIGKMQIKMRKEPFQMDKTFKKVIIPNIEEDVGKQIFQPGRQSKSQYAHLAISSKARDVHTL